MQASLFGDPPPPQDADVQPPDVTTAAADDPSDVIAEPPPRPVPTPPPADQDPAEADTPAAPPKPNKRRAQHAPDKDEYNADQIQVLEDLEAVRMRPSMYIGSTGPTGLRHLIVEIADNCVDEAMAGFATRINVTIAEDGHITVKDNGRGIPIHPPTDRQDRPSITTTVQGGMSRRAARRLAWERLARSLHRLLQPPQQLSRPEPFPGQHFPHHPVDLGPGDPGHLFPPNPAADSGERLQPAGTGPHGDATQPRCGSRTRPVPHRSSPSRTPFQCATWNRPRRPASPGECPRERWTDSKVPAVDGPVDFAGLPLAGWPHPLGATVAAGTLVSLCRYLPPDPPAIHRCVLHGPALTVSQPGFAGTPESLILRTGPSRLPATCRRGVQPVHPQRRQPVPEGRRHPEGVVPSNPLGPEVAALQGPLQHLQGQPGLRPVAPSLLRHPRRCAPAFVRGPVLRQIQPFVHQGPPQRADVSQEHPGLAVGHLAQSPAVLPGHSPTSCPAWGSRCRPAPTPPQGVPNKYSCNRPITASSSQGDSAPLHHPG